MKLTTRHLDQTAQLCFKASLLTLMLCYYIRADTLASERFALSDAMPGIAWFWFSCAWYAVGATAMVLLIRFRWPFHSFPFWNHLVLYILLFLFLRWNNQFF
ncbi:MAG TPA: hypothetical protein DCR93_07480 [Cytophagales bacterium]|nr:hypothetical protein [Cytophagales bacterium]HAP59338.1 hypothetical protein [Cytophagales bacterium]